MELLNSEAVYTESRLHGAPGRTRGTVTLIRGGYNMQDQIEFENRSSRRRGAPEPDLMPEEDMGEEADGAPTAEELFSAGPTMMGAKARNMLLSGDKNAGLASYKSRMYRKMDADDEEKV